MKDHYNNMFYVDITCQTRIRGLEHTCRCFETWTISLTPVFCIFLKRHKAIDPFYLVSMSLLPGVYVLSTWCLCPFYLVSMSLLSGVYVLSTWCLCPFYLLSMPLLSGVYAPSTWCLCPFYLVSMPLLPVVYAHST